MLVTLNEMKSYLGIGGIIYPPVIVNLSIDTTTGRITRASGNWNTDKVIPGSLITLSGFSNGTNNVQVAVTGIVSTTIISYLGPSGMITEIGTGTSFDQADVASNTSYDTFLTDQLGLISDSVEAYCGRKFELTSYVQTFYVDTMRDLYNVKTYSYPIKTVTYIKEDTIDITGYRLDKTIGHFFNPIGLVSGQSKELVISYDAGFDVIPSPVKSVVYSIVEERYNKKKSGVNLNFGSDVQRISIPGTISVDFDYSLQSNERKAKFGTILGNYINILDPYRSERVVTSTGGNIYVA